MKSLRTLGIGIFATALVAFAVSTNAAEKRQVVVYVANTPNEARLNELAGWMDESGDAELKKWSDRFRNDVEKFPAAVAEELGLLKTKAEEGAFELVVATNATALEGELEVYDGKRKDFSRRCAPLPTAIGDAASHPIADVENLRAILVASAEMFDPATHEFVLIVKSHGSDKLAMATLMNAKMDVTSKEELLDRVDAVRLASVAVVPQDVLSPSDSDSLRPDGNPEHLSPEADSTLAPEVNCTLSPEVNDTMSAEIPADTMSAFGTTGVSKESMIGLLSERSESGMEFAAVLFDACNSRLEEEHAERLLASIPAVIVSTQEVSYRSIDYGTILANDGSSLVDNLVEWAGSQKTHAALVR